MTLVFFHFHKYHLHYKSSENRSVILIRPWGHLTTDRKIKTRENGKLEVYQQKSTIKRGEKISAVYISIPIHLGLIWNAVDVGVIMSHTEMKGTFSFHKSFSV